VPIDAVIIRVYSGAIWAIWHVTLACPIDTEVTLLDV